MSAGIFISDGTVDATEAKGTSLLFSDTYPLAKIDSTRDTSLQNVLLTFTRDPPNPDGAIATTRDTTVYSFAHGYSYTPKLWLLFQRVAGLAVQNGASLTRDIPYGYEGSIVTQSSTTDFAQFASVKLSADAANVYLQIRKTYQTGGFYVDPAVSLIGYQIRVRIYVFVEDLIGS